MYIYFVIKTYKIIIISLTKFISTSSLILHPFKHNSYLIE